MHADAAAQLHDVWPEHWHAVQWFLHMATQWRAVAWGPGRVYWLGLDYAAWERCEREARRHVPRELRMHRRRDRPRLIEQLQLLEVKAIGARNQE